MESNWQEIQLSEFVSHQKGFAFKSKDYIDSGVPVVRVSNFTNDSIDISDFKFVSQSIANDRLSYELFENDVIVATVGSWPTNPASVVGKVVRVPSNATPSLLNQNAVILRPITDEKLDKVFLFYLLKDKDFSEYIVSTAQGSANQASITLKDIYAYRFYLPHKEDRKMIAKILKRLDDKITLNRKINQTLEQMAQTLFKSWFVDFDPVVDNALDAGFFERDLAFSDELLRRAEARKALRASSAYLEQHKPLPKAIRQLFPAAFEKCAEPTLGHGGWVPKGWVTARLSDIASLQNQSVHPNNEPDKIWRHYSLPAFDNGKMPSNDKGDTIKSGKFKAPKTCVLVSKLNPATKRVWLPAIHDDIYSVCSTEFMPFVPRVGEHRQFLYCMLSSDGFQRNICSKVTGTTGSHQRVKPKEISTMAVLLPGSVLIEKLSQAVAPHFEKIQQSLLENQYLENIRNILLSKLISGELRLDQIEAELAEKK
ncbi:restriction endonuclease subunit S [Shewanella sp. PP-He15 brown]